MNQRYIGNLKVSAIELGCMGMSEFYGEVNEQESLNTIAYALDHGVSFHDRARMLLTDAMQYAYQLDKGNPERDQQIKNETAKIFVQDDFSRENFIQDTLIKHYLLDEKTLITKRELDCIRCLLQGKTTQQIGDILFISPRTVETHITHLKDKLQCVSKADLIEKLHQRGFRADAGFNILR